VCERERERERERDRKHSTIIFHLVGGKTTLAKYEPKLDISAEFLLLYNPANSNIRLIFG